MNGEFYVNIDAVIAASERIGTTFSRLGNLIESNMYSVVKQIMFDEFSIAADIANSQDGFPVRYKEHLLETVSEITPTVLMDQSQLFVNLDLEEWLGGYQDLERAFHQGAKLAGGGTLWGPYEGQALANEAEDRHVFWEALRRGDTTIESTDYVTGVTRKVHVRDSAWEETIEQYLNIWGSKAPQWLLIQFGQEEWPPYVTQVDVVNNIFESVQAFASNYLAEILEQEVEIANRYKATGLEVGYTGATGPARVLSGTITVGGKTYRPGRFAPRGGL